MLWTPASGGNPMVIHGRSSSLMPSGLTTRRYTTSVSAGTSEESTRVHTPPIFGM
jgi:hypothetical protein